MALTIRSESGTESKGKKRRKKKVEIQENKLILLADGFSQTTESKCLEKEGDLRNA